MLRLWALYARMDLVFIARGVKLALAFYVWFLRRFGLSDVMTYVRLAGWAQHAGIGHEQDAGHGQMEPVRTAQIEPCGSAHRAGLQEAKLDVPPEADAGKSVALQSRGPQSPLIGAFIVDALDTPAASHRCADGCTVRRTRIRLP